MGIGIDIRVNGTDKLREAKKEIGMLNNGLRESEQLSDITIQTSGLPNKSDTQSMSDGLRTYASEADKARQSIESLINYQRKLTNAVSPRTQQVAQEQPQRQYKIRDPHIVEPAQNIVSVSHPKGDTFYDSYDPKHEKTVKPRAEVTNAVSPRTQQVAQEYYNTAASQATVMDATKKLKQIDVEGSKKGGVITPGQAAEAARLYKLIQDEQKKYEKEIERTGTKLDELFAKKKKLEQTSPLLRTEGEQKAVEQLKQQIEELTASSEKYQRTQDKTFDKTNKSATQSNQNIQGYKQQEDPAAAATMGSTIKKALGWTLAAAGGFSLLGFLGSSRAQYQQSVGHQGKLSARGIKGGYNDGVGIGINPLEQMQMLENISQSTGMNGDRARAAAKMSGLFGKASGTDPSQIAGMYGSMYQATGNQGSADTTLTRIQQAFGKSLKDARVSELLQMVTRNTMATANAIGGAAGDKQAFQATTLAIEAMKSQQSDAGYANYAKSGNFQDFMQNGLQDAGTDAGNIELMSIMGGFNSPMDFTKIHRLNMAKEGGLMETPEYMQDILGRLRETTPEGRAGELSAKYPKLKGSPASKIIEMADDRDKSGKNLFDRMAEANKGMKDKSPEAMRKGTAEQQKVLAEWENKVKENPALKKEVLEAKREMVKIEAGEQLNEIFGKFETGALEFAHALTKGKGFTDALEKAAKDMGPIAVGLGATALLVTGAPFLGAIRGIATLGGGGAAGAGMAGMSAMMMGPALPLIAAAAVAAIGAIAIGKFGGNDGTYKTDAQMDPMGAGKVKNSWTRTKFGIGASKDVEIDGLQTSTYDSAQKLLGIIGRTGTLTSGFRSVQKQGEIKVPEGGVKASPFFSPHSFGVATDFAPASRPNEANREWYRQNADKSGMTMQWEPQNGENGVLHFEDKKARARMEQITGGKAARDKLEAVWKRDYASKAKTPDQMKAQEDKFGAEQLSNEYLYGASFKPTNPSAFNAARKKAGKPTYDPDKKEGHYDTEQYASTIEQPSKQPEPAKSSTTMTPYTEDYSKKLYEFFTSGKALPVDITNRITALAPSIGPN